MPMSVHAARKLRDGGPSGRPPPVPLTTGWSSLLARPAPAAIGDHDGRGAEVVAAREQDHPWPR